MDNRKSDAGHRRQTEDSYGSKFPPVTFKSLGLPMVQFFDIWDIMRKNHACNKSEDQDAKKDEDPGGGRVGRQGGWWGGAQDDIYWCLWTRPECSLNLASLFNSNNMTYTIQCSAVHWEGGQPINTWLKSLSRNSDSRCCRKFLPGTLQIQCSYKAIRIETN